MFASLTLIVGVYKIEEKIYERNSENIILLVAFSVDGLQQQRAKCGEKLGIWG
jgi:hypothetical protein